jgi:hypothetical protein
MGIQVEGKVGKRYLIRESDPKVRLVFRGRDAKRFTQLDPPKKDYEKVEFSLTVADLADLRKRRTALRTKLLETCLSRSSYGPFVNSMGQAVLDAWVAGGVPKEVTGRSVLALVEKQEAELLDFLRCGKPATKWSEHWARLEKLGQADGYGGSEYRAATADYLASGKLVERDGELWLA